MKKIRRQFALTLEEEGEQTIADRVQLAVSRYNSKPTDLNLRPPAELLLADGRTADDHALRLALGQVRLAVTGRNVAAALDLAIGNKVRFFVDNKRRALRGWQHTG